MDLNDLKKAMKGIFCVQMTPFNKDGSLDLEGMRANTRWLIDRMAGKDFVFVPEGSNGEFFAQSEDEWKAVIKMVVEEVNGRNPVIAGAGQAGTREAIRRCQYAESVGADGVLVVLPYYISPVEEGLYQHYKEIAESIKIGLLLYNNTAVSGSWARPPLVAKLAEIPNFVGVKENTSSVISFRLMQQAVEHTDTVVLSGRGEEVFPYIAPFGCPGFISFVANFAPELAYSVYEAAMERDYDKVFERADVFSFFFKDPEVVRCLPPGTSYITRVAESHGPNAGNSGATTMQFAVIKAAMDLVGLRGGEVRLPLISINDKEREELRSILKARKIIK
ncbi:dihydrodipicolinate synthase family protein [Chloroflexota bacterium]